jgi:hypothetical protein
VNKPRWEDRALERIEARRRKIGELLADEQDLPLREQRWNQLQHLSLVESFVLVSLKIANGERVVSEAEEHRLRRLMNAGLVGASWDELKEMAVRREEAAVNEERPLRILPSLGVFERED